MTDGTTTAVESKHLEQGLQSMQLIRLVVASPGDVQDERDTVSRVAEELNHTFCPEHNVRLEVVRWETDSYPGFHTDGPQGLIDSLLRIEDCDCLVGIFWKRFGTPVKDGKSGTEHEIRKAVEAWKQAKKPQIMVYFSNREANIQSKEEADQWGAVRQFQKGFPSEGLWWSYRGVQEFERLLRTHLMQWIPQVANAPHATTASTREVPDRPHYMKIYKDLIDSAVDQVLLFASKLHRSETMEQAAEINEALFRATQRGVKIRVLLGMAYNRLPAALELSGHGIPVRFDRTLAMSDINYATFDDRIALISLREATNDQSIYKRSVAWTEFTSVQLVSTLRREFDRRWGAIHTASIGLLLRQLVPTAVSDLGVSAVSNQLHMPTATIEMLAKKRPLFIALIGRPGSGKTTIAQELVATVGRSMPEVRVSTISDLPFLSKAFKSTESTRFIRTADGGFFVTDKTLYDEALAHLADQAKRLAPNSDVIIAEFAREIYGASFAELERFGVRPDLIVYVDVPFAIAQQRNKLRRASCSGHYVSDREMMETYQFDDIDAIRNDERVAVLPNEEISRSVAENAACDLFERIRNLSESV